MAFLIIDGERFALPIGESTLGGGGDDALPIPTLVGLPAQAVLTLAADDLAVIRRARPDADVTVDGRPLGAEPERLRHGARLAVAGRELLYGDLRKGGSTAHIKTADLHELALLGALAPAEPTADTGGMLVRVADGAAFPVPDGGLTIGRDPSCAVVLESMEVSRRHAVITPGLFGYALTDTSANGVVVNGARVDGSKVLGRGDVIRIADAEFRFEAAAASYEPSPSLRSTVAVAAPRDARTTQEPLMRAPAPALLATLEIINEDARKGTRFRVERPVVHIGRAPHNDFVLADDSVSGSHASLERRADGWYVIDARSRNGTYVDGARVTGECALRGVAELRFGGVKMVFRPK